MFYENCIVTFIDIMGFKQLVSDTYKDNPEKLDCILDQFWDYFDVGKGPGTVDIRGFSDSIIVIDPITSLGNHEEILNSVFYNLYRIALVQMELFKLNILIRGGVAAGWVYKTDKRIFGEGYQNAYLIESERARVPVVSISQNIIDLVTSVPSSFSYNPQKERVLSLITKDKHDCSYIDYLRVAFDPNTYDYPNEVFSFIKEHRRLITSELNANNHNPVVYAKYLWLKEYHNEHVLMPKGQAHLQIKS